MVHRKGCRNALLTDYFSEKGQEKDWGWEETRGQSGISQHTLCGRPQRKTPRTAADGLSATAVLPSKPVATDTGMRRLKAK